MNPTITNLRTQLTRKQGQKDRVASELAKAEDTAARFQREIQFTETARAIIQKVAKATQAELEYYISELVTLAFASVFPNPYEFSVQFVEKRGKTECEMKFIRDGHTVNPMYASGGGPLDVACSTLQFTIWSLNKTRPIIGLDEPFRFLSRDLQPKAAAMIKEISRKLKLQILMVTHSPDLIESADRVFRVSLKDGVSLVEKN
jgi:hypothetical protein